MKHPVDQARTLRVCVCVCVCVWFCSCMCNISGHCTSVYIPMRLFVHFSCNCAYFIVCVCVSVCAFTCVCVCTYVVRFANSCIPTYNYACKCTITRAFIFCITVFLNLPVTVRAGLLISACMRFGAYSRPCAWYAI